MMRLFIALPLEKTVEDRLEGIIDSLAQKGGSVKWVKPRNIHLTLRFLGDTDERLVGRIKTEIDAVAAAHGPVKTAISRLGAFPNLNRPRVIWVGIEERLEDLRKMARDMELRARTLRFEKESRAFKAHLTLGRIRNPQGLDELTDYMKDYALAEIPVVLDRIVLFKSTLTPQGPIYDRLHEAALSAK
ncbi:MAG: RNA 2',3'-cyclic phosphodiesterase [Candidatus Zixiibacteriota bacterium]|nr:MAG: RNA 2',3'-cyclic phosphodiesterase [candidate division Zixibacteria bacterium]